MSTEKHLEFIQGAISRMAKSSFLIKGWAVTIVSALIALAEKDANMKYVAVGYFPAVLFWLLDGYYLYQERLFRDLYDDVRENSRIDFSMDTSQFDKGASAWAGAVFSKTIFPFYLAIFLTLVIVMIDLKK